MKFRIVTAFIAALATSSCIGPIELTPDIVGEIVAFEVEGQVRSSVNTSSRTVGIELGEGADLAAVRVTRIELTETASCDISAGSVLDLTVPLKVVVSTAADYEWTIMATIYTDSRRPLPGGSFDEWHRADRDGTPNPEGKVWNPWPAGAVLGDTRWWDTGNEGVTLIGASNSTPTEAGEGCPANPRGRAARLESKYVVMKVAGGNIYFGEFGELNFLDATCIMGHPWSSKPRGLKGWYKYFPRPIDRVGGQAYLDLHPFGPDFEWKGKMDSLHVSIALWASPDGANIPFTVDTTPANYSDLTRESDGVIAWGSLVSGDEQAEWAEFDIEMEYFTDAPLPANTYLVVQATSSKHCNYFIAGTSGGNNPDNPDDTSGKTGSLMYIDELELVYD